MSLLERRRRGGAPAAVRPAPLALGARYWWDPAVDVTLDGALRVASHVDRISALDAIQGSATRRPGYLASDPLMGGRPALSYVRTNPDFISASVPNALATDPHTICGTGYWDGANPGTISGTATAGGNAWSLFLMAGGAASASQRNDAAAGTSTSAAFAAVPGRIAGITMDDGVDISARTSAAFSSVPRIPRPLSSNRLWMGSYNTGTPLTGRIGHVVWFDRSLSASESAQMLTWLQEQIA